MDIKKYIFLNGFCRKYKNRKVYVVKPHKDFDAYTLEILNHDPEYANLPCAKHSVLRNSVGVSTIALSRLSMISAAISIMDILGAETKENLLDLEELAVLHRLKMEGVVNHLPTLSFLDWWYANDLRTTAFLGEANKITNPSDAEVNADECVLFHAFNDLSTYTADKCLEHITAKADELGITLIVALDDHNLPYEQDFKNWGFEGVEMLDKTKDYLSRKPKK